MMEKKAFLIIVLLLFSITPCMATYQSKTVEYDIAEVVFRRQFQYRINQSAYYIRLFGKDPDASFMARFENNSTPIHGYSKHKEKGDFNDVINPDTNGPALVCAVDKIELTGQDEAVVKGSIFDAADSAGGYVYIVKLVSGKWQIIEERETWIS